MNKHIFNLIEKSDCKIAKWMCINIYIYIYKHTFEMNYIQSELMSENVLVHFYETNLINTTETGSNKGSFNNDILNL